MTRRLLVSYLLMALIILTMLTVPLGLRSAEQSRDRLLTAIERDGRVLAAESDDAFENRIYTSLPGLVTDYVRQTGGRVVMVDATGRSVVDSSDLSGAPRDFSTRPEIQAALAGRFTTGARDSATLGESLSFVVVPVRHEHAVIGAVRVSYPTTSVESRTRNVWLQLVLLDVAAVLVVAMAGWFVARTLGRPIRALESTADQLATGDLEARVAIEGPADLQRVGRTFNSMADRLQGMVESQRAFLADASHQLRTPLTALRLRLEPFADSDQLTPEMESDVGAVLNEVDRLSELVEALLAMARLDAQPGALVTAAIGEIAEDRIAMWSALADEQDVTLRLDDRAPSAEVRTVDGGLEQILDNLIANAIEHSPEGSTITVEVAPATGSVDLTVSDEGPGLSDAQIAKAFDRYWRGPEPSEGGSGLGLAIVKALAESAGGTVRMGRGAHGGLAVTVTLVAEG